MHLITQLYRVNRVTALTTGDFKTDRRRWPLHTGVALSCGVSDEGYQIENHSETAWQVHRVRAPLPREGDFSIEAELSCLSKEAYGHFGLVWGLDPTRESGNRFTLSADGERIVMLRFNKKHRKTTYRTQLRPRQGLKPGERVHLALVRMQGYCHFLLQGELINVVREDPFRATGTEWGFFLEPGLTIVCHALRVNRLNTTSLPVLTGLNQLLGQPARTTPLFRRARR